METSSMRASMKLDVRDKKVLVLGVGHTGSSVCKALVKLRSRVHATDSRPTTEIAQAVQELSSLGIQVQTGGHPIEALNNVDLVVISPGVSYDTPIVVEAKKRGIEVLSEVDVAYRLNVSRLISITGTNGKSTTSTLVGEMLQFPVANAEADSIMGPALITLVSEYAHPTIIVELKSFQLARVNYFRSEVGLLLNIAEDHIDKHGTFEKYAEIKRRIFRDQEAGDIAILNFDDDVVMVSTKSIKSTPVFFSAKTEVPYGVWIEGRTIVSNIHSRNMPFEVARWEDIAVPRCLYEENIIAAITVALVEGVSIEKIGDVLTHFGGLPDRLEFIGEIEGINYYNDSKSKNPASTIKAIQCLKAPVVLIAGGETKNIDFSPLLPYIRLLRGLVLVGHGSSTKILIELAKVAHQPQFCVVDTMASAVRAARNFASKDDVVLLSPASDYDNLFRNFRERGEQFRDCVQGLITETIPKRGQAGQL